MSSKIVSAASLSTTCRACDRKGTTLAHRRVFVTNGTTLCCSCGADLDCKPDTTVPPEVARIIRSLLAHGVMMLHEDVKATEPEEASAGKKRQLSPTFSVQLDRFEGCYMLAGCRLEWCLVERDSRKDDRPKNKYTRDAIKAFVPEPVHQTCNIVSDSDDGQRDAMNVTMADVSKPVKSVRFERYCKQYTSRNVLDSCKHLRVRVEITWKEPEREGNLFLPLADEALALRIMRDGIDAEGVADLQVCLNRGIAEGTALQAAGADNRAYLLVFHANEYAAGLALFEDAMQPATSGEVPIAFDTVVARMVDKTHFQLGPKLREVLKRLPARAIHLETVNREDD